MMTQQVSTCCGKELMHSCADEGTCCYICTNCHKPSDPKPEEVFTESINSVGKDYICHSAETPCVYNLKPEEKNSKFSEFFRNALPEEKKKVMLEVAKEAAEEQRKVISPQQPSSWAKQLFDLATLYEIEDDHGQIFPDRDIRVGYKRKILEDYIRDLIAKERQAASDERGEVCNRQITRCMEGAKEAERESVCELIDTFSDRPDGEIINDLGKSADFPAPSARKTCNILLDLIHSLNTKE